MKTIIIILVLLLGLSVVLGQVRKSEAPIVDTVVTQPQATSTPKLSEGEVKLITPAVGSVVTSPLVVKGEAKGYWFFEANLPIFIEDANGKVLAQAGAQAQGEWMTTESVPFTGTLTFNPGTSVNGFIVVKNDNPSGLPENEKSFRFPIRFK
jgi:hypothetical protein